MSESCANCMWARQAVPRVREERERADMGTWDWSKGPNPPTPPPDFYAERRRCVRMPQAVENDATYWCGEHLKKREAA